MNQQALIITPHSSGHIPLDVLADMLGEDVYSRVKREERLRWMFDEGDPYTDVIFHAPQALTLHATVSRFVVDFNRDRNEGGNNGVIKLTDFEGRSLYPDGFELTAAARECRLRRYWDAFHTEVRHCIEHDGVRLLINGHSMQPNGPVIGPDQGRPRPALTLMTAGNDQGEVLPGRTHSSVSAKRARALLALLERHFMDIVQSCDGVPSRIALNDPWAVDELSYRYSHPERSHPVPGFGVEINRALYLTYPPGGGEEPNEPVIQALNVAFQAFLNDALSLVSEVE